MIPKGKNAFFIGVGVGAIALYFLPAVMAKVK